MEKDLKVSENDSTRETSQDLNSNKEQPVATRRSSRRSVQSTTNPDFLTPTTPKTNVTKSTSKNDDKTKSKENNTDSLITKTIESSNNNELNSVVNKKSAINNNTNNKNRKNSLESEPTKEEPKATENNKNNKKSKTKKNEPENIKPKWKEGIIVEAKDESGNWYKSRIIDIDEEDKQVKVHFLGWNSRYDQWFDMDGDDLRICASAPDSNEPQNEIETTSSETNNESSLSDKFEIGAQVLAKWNDDSFYPAIVTRYITKNSILYYQVKFYDGVKKMVRFSNAKVLTEEDAKYFNIEFNKNNNIKTNEAPEINNDKIKQTESKTELENRHAEAELLLAIQEPKLINNINENKKLIDQNITNEEKLEDKTKIDNISQEPVKEVEEPKIILKENDKLNTNEESAINNQITKEPESKQDNQSTSETIQPTDSSARKSLRVKRLRTFTKEIVFDSPASSIAYNLASVSNPAKLISTDQQTITPQSSNKRRKLTSTSTIDEATSSKAADDSSINLDDSVFESSLNLSTSSSNKKLKEDDTKLIQNYFKSLKIFKTNKKQNLSTLSTATTPSTTTIANVSTSVHVPVTPTVVIKTPDLGNVSMSKSGRISISSKRKQEYEEEKAEELRAREEKKKQKLAQKEQKEITPKKPSARELKRLKKKMEKKKLKKDKKKLLKKLIESSQQQLKQQQELIEKQLKKHEHKKSQKKLQKLLKQQQLQLQLQIQQQIQFQQHQIQQQNIFFPATPQPQPPQQQQLFNNLLFNPNLIKSMSQTSVGSSTGTSSLSNEPIKCHFEDCKKTFRKQSLLEYHLKYHHYALQTPSLASTNPMSPVIVTPTPTLTKKVSVTSKRNSSQNHNASEDSNDYYEGDDPYEVIHCKCGNNVSIGFMIQCEICLCWQHGDCANIKSAKLAPKNYLCWICRVPSNKLRQLKYQNWMNELKNKDMCLSQSHFKLDNNSGSSIDLAKLRLLNECSKKYYNLNLLMYTLEYQMSMLTQISKNESLLELDLDQINDLSNVDSLDDETIEQVEKLLQNISHLQECLSKRFNEFNSKIDGNYFLFHIVFSFNIILK